MQGKTSRVNDSRKKEEEVVAMGLHKQVPRRVHVGRERREAVLGINAPVNRSLGRHSFRRCLRFPRLPQVLILGRHFFCFSSLVTHTQTHATKRCVRLQQLPPLALSPTSDSPPHPTGTDRPWMTVRAHNPNRRDA